MDLGKAVYTVIDVETTGTSDVDHIVEFALIDLDESLNVIDEFETLVRPGRDLGDSSSVHKLEAVHLRDAPRFRDLAGHLIERLRDRYIVGYNVAFDWRTITHEFGRLNYSVPRPLQICLLETFKRANPKSPNLSLTDLCHELNIELLPDHSAKGDAQASLEVFRVLKEEALRQIKWLPHSFSLAPRTLKRKDLLSREIPPSAPLARFFETPLPRPDDTPTTDKACSAIESYLLGSQADEALITQGAPQHVEHQLEALVSRILEDGALSELEYNALVRLYTGLGMESLFATKPLDGLKRYPRDLPGLKVCFSGTFQCVHEGQVLEQHEAEQRAQAIGMVVANRHLTKSHHFLVVRDVNSDSKKTTEARRFGVPIISEFTFWNWMGIVVS